MIPSRFFNDESLKYTLTGFLKTLPCYFFLILSINKRKKNLKYNQVIDNV